MFPRLLLLAVAVSLLVSGCPKSPSSSGADKSCGGAGPARALRIAMSFQELDNPYFAVMKQALDEAGRSLGAELFVTDARHDVTKQINDIEDLIQKRIDSGPRP